MASKRRLRRNACSGKLRFNSVTELYEHSGKIIRKNRLEAYHCKYCGGWHCGHR